MENVRRAIFLSDNRRKRQKKTNKWNDSNDNDLIKRLDKKPLDIIEQTKTHRKCIELISIIYYLVIITIITAFVLRIKFIDVWYSHSLHTRSYTRSCSYSAPTAKINGQTTPLDVTGLSQNEIQALLLGSHPSTQNINVKREPEDLRKDPKCSRNQKVRFYILYLCAFSSHTIRNAYTQRHHQKGAPALLVALECMYVWVCMIELYISEFMCVYCSSMRCKHVVHTKTSPKNPKECMCVLLVVNTHAHAS